MTVPEHVAVALEFLVFLQAEIDHIEACQK
jgi:hypothetical protein